MNENTPFFSKLQVDGNGAIRNSGEGNYVEVEGSVGGSGGAAGRQAAGAAIADAAGTDVDVGSRGTAGDRGSKPVVRHAKRLEELSKPDALRLIRVDGYVHAARMIEAEGAVERGITFRADGKRTAELTHKRGFDGPQNGVRERP
jgi:hypothetical protein